MSCLLNYLFTDTDLTIHLTCHLQTAASPLALLAATCSKITPGSASEYGPSGGGKPTPLAESLVARSINKSLEEERRNRERKNSGLPFAPGLIQVRSKLIKHEINAISRRVLPI